MHDLNGRPYAKLSELKVGDQIELDSGFTCHPPGVVVVKGDDRGLFFDCAGDRDPPYGLFDERHYLDGQADDGEHLIGVYLVG